MKYYLSTDHKLKGKPIAVIQDGTFEGNILYVVEGNPPPGVKPVTYVELSDEEGKIMPLPNMSLEDEQYDVIGATGPGGSGKSYIIKEMVRLYRKRFPDRPCFLVSQLKKDTTLDSLDPPLNRIPLDSILKVDRWEPEEHLEPSFIIFDDFEGLPTKQLKKVWDLINTIATEGRHTSTQLAVILHTLNNGTMTRTFLREVKQLFIYPRASSFNSYRYALEKQMGLTIDEIRALKRINTRWICFRTQAPQVMLTEHSVKIMNQDDEPKDTTKNIRE